MAIYNLGIGGAATSPLECGPDDVRCYGLDVGHHMHEQGALFDYTVCFLLNRLEQRYEKSARDLVVGDIIHIPLPTYSVLESVRTHIEAPTRGLTFDIEDSLGRTLEGHHVQTTFTPATAPATGCTQAVTDLGTDSPTGLGADNRDRWDFTRTDVPVFYDVPGGLNIVLTALPATGTIDDLDIRIFIGVRRDGICHGRVCDTQTQTPPVTP